METVVDFISKVSDMVKSSMKETKGCIGKEVVDTTAGRKGVCVDRITDFFGTKISFLGVKYNKDEIVQIEKTGEDVLVIQSSSGKFFMPLSDVSAVGNAILLLKKELKAPEMEAITAKRNDVFKRYQLTKEAIKDVLPNAIPPSDEKEDKKWLKRLIGE